MRVLLYVAFVGAALASDNDWQPIVPESSLNYATVVKSPQRALGPKLKIVNRRPAAHSRPYTLGSSENHLSSLPHLAPPHDDSCSIFKIGMNQELFYQYLEYEKEIPDLHEFTLCMWTKFHNHTGDHPLFSYAVSDSPKEISAWISNNAQASFFSMAVHGQTFFRLNYPLKLNKWYHSCQSWNGKTGEWQIWVNAERVGRGFHNRLVGHVIKGGGLAISGQDQSLLYKDELEPTARQPGLMGEITMVQLYHVALTAGKAHKDHKHHHAHHFTHDGQPLQAAAENVTEPPPPIPTPLGNGNFLIGNQIQRLPNLNIAGAQEEQMVPVQLPNGLQLQQQFVNGQLGNRIVSEQLLGSAQQNGLQQPQRFPTHGQSLEQQFLNGQLQVGGAYPILSSPVPISNGPSVIRLPQNTAKTTVLLSGSLINPANVQFIDDSSPHSLFRRESTKRDKRDNPEKELKTEITSGKKEKRDLVSLPDGSIVDEALLSPHVNTNSNEEEDLMFQQSLMDGLAGFVGNLPVQNEQKDTVDEREPAEAEVKAVMEVCSGCAPEPFKKALVLSWRTVAKKLYSGTHYYKGVPICRAF